MTNSILYKQFLQWDEWIVQIDFNAAMTGSAIMEFSVSSALWALEVL